MSFVDDIYTAIKGNGEHSPESLGNESFVVSTAEGRFVSLQDAALEAMNATTSMIGGDRAPVARMAVLAVDTTEKTAPVSDERDTLAAARAALEAAQRLAA